MARNARVGAFIARLPARAAPSPERVGHSCLPQRLTLHPNSLTLSILNHWGAKEGT